MADRPAAVHVGVIGPSSASADIIEQARQVGELLANRGATLLVGGSRGVSQAAAEGALAQGGTVVGLLPDYGRPAVGLRATVIIPTGLGELSNGLVVRASDALVSIGGGWGTLMEIALAARTDVPVVCLNGWTLRDSDDKLIKGPIPTHAVMEAVRLAHEAALRRSTDGRPRIG